MEMKKCSKCGEEKEMSLKYFLKETRSKTGLSASCRVCHNNRSKKYREKNPEIYSYEYRKDYQQDYYQDYYHENKNTILSKNREYQKENIDKIRIIRNERYNTKRKEDKIFHLKTNLQSLIRSRLKSKKTKRTCEILGCTIENFKDYIESKFQDGMSWDNYGVWELDHIYPISLAVTQSDVYKLNHYTNFQPLWKKENIKKSNKLLNHE